MPVPAAASYARLALPGLRRSSLVAEVCLAAANREVRHSCFFVAADTAESAAVAAADVVGVEEVASIDRVAAGAFACSARRVSVALEEELGVLARTLAKPKDLVCRV